MNYAEIASSVLIALYTFLKSYNKDKKKEADASAIIDKSITKLKVDIDNNTDDISDIKDDIENVRDDIGHLKDDLQIIKRKILS